LAHQVLQEVFVGNAGGKIAMATHTQRLVHRFFEAVMRLFHIAIFVGHACVVPRGLHAVVSHERFIALRKGFVPSPLLMNGCAQMIGPVHQGHPS
jgi:hypothetical protein